LIMIYFVCLTTEEPARVGTIHGEGYLQVPYISGVV
jgi:hypothetical protein